MLVDTEDCPFVVLEPHCPIAEAKMFRSRLFGTRKLDIERVLVAALVSKMKIGEFAPRLGESMEIRRERNAGQFLGQVVRETFSIMRMMQDCVDVIKYRVFRDGIVAVFYAESAKGCIGDIVHSFEFRLKPRKLVLRIFRMLIPVAGKALTFRNEFKILHHIDNQSGKWFS